MVIFHNSFPCIINIADHKYYIAGKLTISEWLSLAFRNLVNLIKDCKFIMITDNDNLFAPLSNYSLTAFENTWQKLPLWLSAIQRYWNRHIRMLTK